MRKNSHNGNIGRGGGCVWGRGGRVGRRSEGREGGEVRGYTRDFFSCRRKVKTRKKNRNNGIARCHVR